MLTHFTWTQYWTVLLSATTIYYLIIALLFFRQEITALLRARINHHHSGTGESKDKNGKANRKSGFDGLEPVVADIKSIMQKAGSGAAKDPLIEQLTERVALYDGMGHPAFRNAIKQYIIRNAETICGVAVSEQELEAAWGSHPRNF